jgi:hypothetical protein
VKGSQASHGLPKAGGIHCDERLTPRPIPAGAGTVSSVPIIRTKNRFPSISNIEACVRACSSPAFRLERTNNRTLLSVPAVKS